MRKRFLLILSLFIVISLIVAGSVYILIRQQEKAQQRAFALPIPNPQLKWTETKNSKNDWGLYLLDLKTGEGGYVSLNGTIWIYNKLVKNENIYVQRENFFSEVTDNWFESNNWVSEANIRANDEYRINVTMPMGVGNDTRGYLKVWDDKVRVVYWSTYTSRDAYTTAKPPYPENELNYPFTVEYKIFISNVVPIKDIIK
ncbi:hypothetical protein KJ678_01065 [Patescibacteria group bacterium]|nr:hypothetical protein [Patescibacteria group bacterium]